MALDLSRGFIPNLFLWFGDLDSEFTPTDVPDIFDYPTIPPVSSSPPCTPVPASAICDIRCDPKDENCGPIEGFFPRTVLCLYIDPYEEGHPVSRPEFRLPPEIGNLWTPGIIFGHCLYEIDCSNALKSRAFFRGLLRPEYEPTNPLLVDVTVSHPFKQALQQNRSDSRVRRYLRENKDACTTPEPRRGSSCVINWKKDAYINEC